MYQLRHVLQHVVQGLDDAPFAKHHLVVQRHQSLLHVRPETGHNVYAVIPEPSEKGLRYVALVSIKLAENLVGQRVHYRFIPVVDIRAGKHETDYLPLLVAEQMQPEAYVPSLGGDVAEVLHAVLPPVMYDRVQVLSTKLMPEHRPKLFT